MYARAQSRDQSWRTLQPGLATTELTMRVGRMRLPMRIIVARIDVKQFDVSLDARVKENKMTGAWNIDSVANDVVVAFNAGQFKETGPWGWLVMDGKELRSPGFGPLSIAIAIDTANSITWHSPNRLIARSPTRFGFQSYPLLIREGRIAQLLLTSDDVDRGHRDSRLILGEAGDGSLLVALSRYDGLGGVAERVPIGLTVMESTRIMQRLGARYAVMLDGGLSAQLLLRDSAGIAQKWRGLREVPLALVFRRKP
ncbi:MAG TPA: phosphodiester glycosidase family protein [Longimicrobiales bacterium]|nr:phosphodiester glycosidase family protein [Longimicrobiales bacterium]